MRLTTVKGLVESPKGEWDMNKKYKKSLAALLLCGIFLLIGCQEDVNKDDIAEDTIRFMTFNMRQTAGIDPVKNCLRGLTLLRKNKLSKEITNKTEPIVPIVFGSILR